ncbi:MAG: autotransporter-associated beta strand repeat-containing protein [Saprospiraceae bacterium]|nr:autotransporter-associated beta strand repeat-containing protein [Saprospiraceae bacterium]
MVCIFCQNFLTAQVRVAHFNFPATNPLVDSAKTPNVIVSNMSLSAGTLKTNVTTGTYFPNEPYIQASGGWTTTTQTPAKNFNFTITAASGYIFSITNISFRAYATSSGPSVCGVSVGSTPLFNTNMPSAKILVVNQAVTGQTGLTKALVKIQGWKNNSRTTTGGGIFRLDDVIVTGILTTVLPPTKMVITAITPASPSAGKGFSMTVQSLDPNNNPSPVLANTAFSLSSNTNAGAIGGTIAGEIPIGSNSVTLTDVTLATIGTDATITATRTSGDALTAATSPPFNVLSAATKLAFVGLPTTGLTLMNLSTFTVEARRDDNSIDSSFIGDITLSKATGADTLSGTKIATAAIGIATFNALQIGTPSTYTLNASATGLTATTSDNLLINQSIFIGWNNASSSTAWYTNTNWLPITNAVTATSGAKWLPIQVAQFSNIGTATKAGINLNTSSLSLGTIEATSSRTRALAIENSSTMVGTLTLNGNTLNGITNTILRNAGTGVLSLRNTTTTKMTIALGNETENVIAIDSTGDIKIEAAISGVNKNLTLDGKGTGELSLDTINPFSGVFKVKNGTARLNFNASIASVSSIIVESNGYLYSAANLTDAINDNTDITLNGDAALDISGGTETLSTITSSATASLFIGDNGAFLGDFTLNNSKDVNFAGIIDGIHPSVSPIFIKQGAGKLTLTGENTYTGLTRITEGIVQLNVIDGNTLVTTNDVTVNGGTLQISSNQTLNNLVVEGGNVVVDDGITLTINGTLTLTTGKITLGASGTGEVVLNTNAIIAPQTPTSASYIITNGSGGLTQMHAANNPKTYPVGASASHYDPATITPDGICTFKVNVANNINPTYTLPERHTATATSRQWNVSLLSGTPSVTLSLTASDLSRRPSGVSGIIGHWNATTWEDMPASYANGTWTTTGIRNFSPFIVSKSISLGILLKTFTAHPKNQNHLLTWTTVAEENNAYFDIEHATDNLIFRSIGRIKGQGTTKNENNYTFDYTPTPLVKTHYYRLRQVDFDGTETFSKIISLESNNKNEPLMLYPSTVYDKITVVGTINNPTPYSIFNLLGQNVQSGQIPITKEINAHTLLTGIYIFKMGDATVKFFKN